MIRNKKGNILSSIIIVAVILFLGVIGFLYANSAAKGDASRNAAERIVQQVVDVTIGILNATIGLLVGTSGLATEIAFLRIMVFVLLAIIIVGAMDSINIFGDDDKAKWTNLIVGIIVSIIGVRFLPNDMWQALTAPSSAFVFAMMMGVPLVALGFVVASIRIEIIRKIIVAAYIVGTIWLFYMLDGIYQTMTLVFAIVALLLLLGDAQIIAYLRKEKYKRDVVNELDNLNLVERKNLRAEIKELNEVINDTNADEKDRASAKRRIKRIKKMYGEQIA